jgi:hypothetical protein
MDTQGFASPGLIAGDASDGAYSDGRWESLRDRLADCWPVLTLSELESTHGRPAMLAAILESKIGYAQRLAREALGQPRPVKPRMRARRRLASVRLPAIASALALLLATPFR